MVLAAVWAVWNPPQAVSFISCVPPPALRRARCATGGLPPDCTGASGNAFAFRHLRPSRPECRGYGGVAGERGAACISPRHRHFPTNARCSPDCACCQKHAHRGWFYPIRKVIKQTKPGAKDERESPLCLRARYQEGLRRKLAARIASTAALAKSSLGPQ